MIKRRNNDGKKMRPLPEGGNARKSGRLGVLEWFRIGEHDRVDQVLDDLKTLGVMELRTGVSWADACTPEGDAWYAWLLPQLARRVNVLPCFVDTPPGWAQRRRRARPPAI